MVISRPSWCANITDRLKKNKDADVECMSLCNNKDQIKKMIVKIADGENITVTEYICVVFRTTPHVVEGNYTGE